MTIHRLWSCDDPKIQAVRLLCFCYLLDDDDDILYSFYPVSWCKNKILAFTDLKCRSSLVPRRRSSGVDHPVSWWWWWWWCDDYQVWWWWFDHPVQWWLWKDQPAVWWWWYFDQNWQTFLVMMRRYLQFAGGNTQSNIWEWSGCWLWWQYLSRTTGRFLWNAIWKVSTKLKDSFEPMPLQQLWLQNLWLHGIMVTTTTMMMTMMVKTIGEDNDDKTDCTKLIS